MTTTVFRRAAAAALLGLLAASYAAAELKITGETTVPRDRMVRLRVEGQPAGAAVVWDVSDDQAVDGDEHPDGRLHFVAPPGTYRVKARAILVDKEGGLRVESARTTVTVTPTDPKPPTPPSPPSPPTPPQPTPPNPPQPTPPEPAPAPIPAEGLRVIILYDSENEARMPAAQQAVLYAAEVRRYLNEKCVQEPSGRRGYGIWDAKADVSAYGKLYTDAVARPRKTLPWLIVSTGRTGYEGPLPATVADTMALLRRYGGE